MNDSYPWYDLAVDLFDIGSVKIDTSEGGGFKMKIHETQPDAPRSPIFLNLRTPSNPKPGPLTPEIIRKIGQALWDIAKDKKLVFDGVAGLPNAGLPIAEAFVAAARRDGVKIPLLILGKETTAEKRTITGIRDNGGLAPSIDGHRTIILVLDDLITAGGSKDEGINVFFEAGYMVRDVVVLVDREQGGAEYLQGRGITLHAKSTLAQIVSDLGMTDVARISKQDRGIVLSYLDTQKYRGKEKAA